MTTEFEFNGEWRGTRKGESNYKWLNHIPMKGKTEEISAPSIFILKAIILKTN